MKRIIRIKRFAPHFQAIVLLLFVFMQSCDQQSEADQEIIPQDHSLAIIEDQWRADGFTEDQIDEFKKTLLANGEVTEAELKELRKKSNPKVKTEQTYGNYAFISTLLR